MSPERAGGLSAVLLPWWRSLTPEERALTGVGWPTGDEHADDPPLSEVSDEELDAIVERVDEERNRRTDAKLLDAIRTVLAHDKDLAAYTTGPDAQMGPPVKVVFTTWDWDNGWFFQESNAELHDANGITEEYDFSDNELVTNLLADVSGQAAIGQRSTLTVDLTAGTLDID